jgi:hypothetical protein
MRERALVAAIVSTLCLGAPGCLWHKKHVPPQAAQTPRQTAPKRAAARKATRSSAKGAVQRRTSRPHANAQAAPPPSAPVGPPAPPPSPAPLGQMLTQQERADLNRALDQSLSSTRHSLSEIAERSLSPDEAETLNLVRAFLSQAERVRSTDLNTAAQLARRAELLARSLVAGR